MRTTPEPSRAQTTGMPAVACTSGTGVRRRAALARLSRVGGPDAQTSLATTWIEHGKGGQTAGKGSRKG
jgi:hypothetical protein